MANAFSSVSPTSGGHFRLHFYGAVLRLQVYIARLGKPGSGAAAGVFHRFPFLYGYAQEIAPLLPAGLNPLQAAAWWEEAVHAWQAGVNAHLPLQALESLEGVGCPGRAAFVLAGLVEEDSRFGTLLQHLQEPLPARRLTLETASRILAASETPGLFPRGEGEPCAWERLGDLFAAGALEAANPAAPRAEWMLRVPAPVWDAARGWLSGSPGPGRSGVGGEVTGGPQGKALGGVRYYPPQDFPDMDALILPTDFLERLRQAPGLLAAGRARALVLRGSPGSIRLQAAGAVARALGRGVVEVSPQPPAPALPVEDLSLPAAELREPPVYPRSLGVLCTLANAMPVFTFDLAPGETAPLPDLPGCPAPAAALLGAEGGVSGSRLEGALSLSLPFPGPELRLRHWQAALGQTPAHDLEAIVARFLLPGDAIRRAAGLAAAEAALDGRAAVCPEDVRRAARALNRQALDNLAEGLPAAGSWGQLVAGTATLGKLHELYQRCRYRERLLERLGPAFGSSANRGVRALFSGSSGTGKTLAARILAAELGMDLYRIDLAAVVNKYIGETEKNLHRVLSRAEELDVILLLDEGDSLLGSRTEVRSSNDRYANLETNYLLQRLEHYQGILLVTSNATQNIDSAFQRRMDVVVHFVLPQADERLAIWNLHLPEDHAVRPAALRAVADRCDLTGGQIRNAALLATLLAVGDGAYGGETPVQDHHVEAAVRAEYRKAGAVCPEILEGGEGEEGDWGSGAWEGGAPEYGAWESSASESSAAETGSPETGSGPLEAGPLEAGPFQAFAGLLRG